MVKFELVSETVMCLVLFPYLFPLLPLGATIQLGKGTVLRFNHPNEAGQLNKKRQVHHHISF